MRGFIYGGERGIRTLDGLLTHTPLAGERLQPLGHLSVGGGILPDLFGDFHGKNEKSEKIAGGTWDFALASPAARALRREFAV